MLSQSASAPATTSPSVGQPVEAEFEGYVVEAGTEPSSITNEQLQAQYGSLVQTTLTTNPSLRCGISADLSAAVAARVVRIGVLGGGDVFKPARPTDTTLVYATCPGGSALLAIDDATGSVVAFEVAQTLP
jgi:hypothetical protein